MIVLFVSSLLALLITYKGSKNEIPWGLEIAFGLITFIAAIHYNYGNDYAEYEFFFEKNALKDFSWNALWNGTYHKEWGWALLNFIFAPLGFPVLIASLSIVQNYAYYNVIKKYVKQEWWTFAVFLYLFQANLYVLNMSMRRQGFAASLIVLILPWLLSNNAYLLLLSSLILWFATKIHSSALFVVPFLFLLFVPLKYLKWWGVFSIIAYLYMFFNSTVLIYIVELFLSSENFAGYINTYGIRNSSSYGIGYVLLTIPFILSAIYLLYEQKECMSKRIVALCMAGSMLSPFGLMNPMINRIMMYFLPFSIISYPFVYEMFYGIKRYFLLSLIILVICFGYYSFFFDRVWIEHFLQFHSIFEVIL